LLFLSGKEESSFPQPRPGSDLYTSVKKSPAPPKPADRQPILTSTRNLKMAASAHAYVRGSTVKFYEWLESSQRASLPDGPAVWICGDCHVGNLGPIASAEGKIDIQIRDLDQTVIGNPAHDLVRLALSLAMAARSSDLPGVTTARIVEQLTDGYQEALSLDDAEHAPKLPGIVKRILRLAAGRSWKHLADERIEGVAPMIPLGKRFWPLAADERAAIEGVFGQEDVRRLVTSLRSRDDDCSIAVVDAAYWKKGCSSLGRLRFAVLLAIESSERDAVRHCLVDVKEAVAAAAPRSGAAEMPRDNGMRVVEGARHLSPHLGRRMLATRILDRSVFVRELLPQDLKLEIETLTRDEAMEVSRYLGGVVGRAHGRQMGAADRAAWRKAFKPRGSDVLDAPSWLWKSVVDLVGTHEAAYLEHCRRFALGVQD
jgi:uncharacterized protein (DUF2252 family)